MCARLCAQETAYTAACAAFEAKKTAVYVAVRQRGHRTKRTVSQGRAERVLGCRYCAREQAGVCANVCLLSGYWLYSKHHDGTVVCRARRCWPREWPTQWSGSVCLRWGVGGVDRTRVMDLRVFEHMLLQGHGHEACGCATGCERAQQAGKDDGARVDGAACAEWG